ncbi:MAG: sigma-54 dependent transcriptional regulator [Desulfobacterales bacterium]
MPENRNKDTGSNDILIVDDEMPNLKLLSELLGREGYQVRPANKPQVAIDSALGQPPKLILLDVRMPQMDGFEVCKRLKQDERTRDIPIIFISALQDVEDKVRGFEVGGVDFISKPFQEEEVLARVRTHMDLRNLRLNLEKLVAKRTAELENEINERRQAEIELKQAYNEIRQLQSQLQAESVYLQEEIKLEHNFENIIGQSEALKYVLHQIEMVAPQDSTVILRGETGTGKELIARALHQLSPRNKWPLVKVNCAALPAELIESELFGREEGAFTGATTNQVGRFELANKSTLFLDEIGELPFELQAKLLRVLESGEFERLGSPRTLHSDARIITATNRDLEEEVRNKRFREDLWYRLKIFPITIPPLRDRTEDIPSLIDHFVQHFSRKMGKKAAALKITNSSMQALQSYPWPGNVRELKHVVESALITSEENKLHFDLPETSVGTTSKLKSFEEMEREYILDVLKATNWKIKGKNSASDILKLHPNTLHSRIKKLGLKRP